MAMPSTHGAAGTIPPSGALYRFGGFEDRTFNILAHVSDVHHDVNGGDGTAPPERDLLESNVTTHHIDGILAELERRGSGSFRVVSASFFNPFSQTYQPLHASDFPQLPKQLELALTVEWRNGIPSRHPSAMNSDAGRRPKGPSGGSTHHHPNGDGEVFPFEGSGEVAAGDPRRAGNPATQSLRRHIIAAAREALLPRLEAGKITEDVLLDVCADVVRRYAQDRSLAPAVLRTVVETLPPRDLDGVKLLALELAFDHPKLQRAAPTRPRARTPTTIGQLAVSQRAPILRTHERAVLRRGGPPPDLTRMQASADSSGHGGVARHARGKDGPTRPHADRHAGYFRQEPDFRVSPSRERASSGSPSRRLHSGGTTSPSRRSRAGHASAGDRSWFHRNGVEPSDAGGGAMDEADDGSGSLFQSVTYTVAGTFPELPPATALQIGDGQLRVSLTAPATVTSSSEIVVLGNVTSPRSLVGLCWWLAYGPQRIVLNLDRMYAGHMCTTYQVSDTTFVLSFRAGALVPAWDYHVHLTVTALSSGLVQHAQASFYLPPPGATGGLPGIGSAIDPLLSGPHTDEAYRSAYLMAKRSGRWVGLAYAADEERGPLSQKVEAAGNDAETSGSPQAVTGSQQGANAPQSKVGGGKGAPVSVATASTMTSPTKPPVPTTGGKPPPPASTPAPATPLTTATSTAATGAAVTAAGGASSAAGSSGSSGTYQQQLRDFFVNQIEPLYFLSANPMLSEDAFKDLVKHVAARYWLLKSAEEPLTEDIKRRIVADVKTAISAARAAAATPVASRGTQQQQPQAKSVAFQR